jgi:hypothetical protein
LILSSGKILWLRSAAAADGVFASATSGRNCWRKSARQASRAR